MFEYIKLKYNQTTLDFEFLSSIFPEIEFNDKKDLILVLKVKGQHIY